LVYKEEVSLTSARIVPIGITNFRNQHNTFGIKETDRFGHIYCIGKTGAGKSNLLLSMAISDIQQGKGICLIDPHGDIAENISNYVPVERIKDVVYFDATDFDFPIAYNPLENLDGTEHHLIASGLIATFKKIWADSWGPRLEYILRYALLTLLDYPGATLLDIQPLLTDYQFRSSVLRHVRNDHILAFWQMEFDKYSPALKAEAISPILNKVGLFSASTPLRNIVGQREGKVHIREVMDGGKILICNLAKGTIGEDASTILGSMLVTAIQLAAMKRASIPEHERRPFYLYVDEMHSFVSLSFADILSEARKYKLALFLTHQYIEQLHEKIRSAIFGNVGTVISFRVGAEDAKVLAQEFHPVFTEDDLINLPRYNIYIKLMIDGATSKPFSAQTNPINAMGWHREGEVSNYSRASFARPKREVEQTMLNRHALHDKEDSTTLFS